MWDQAHLYLVQSESIEFSEINMFLNGFARVTAFTREVIPGGPMSKDLIWDNYSKSYVKQTKPPPDQYYHKLAYIVDGQI